MPSVMRAPVKNRSPAAKSAPKSAPESEEVSDLDVLPETLIQQAIDAAADELERKKNIPPDRQALIEQALIIQDQQRKVFDDLPKEQREKLQVMAMHAFGGAMDQKQTGKKNKARKKIVSHPDDIVSAVKSGQRRALAKLITRIESTRASDRALAEQAIAGLLGNAGNAIRIGISGVPGVGKSSFIETFGLHVIDQGHRVAVLAVDPSSPKTGGSILGDKTRMEKLARHPDAFIRPSPSGRSIGGVARRTRETIIAVEAAGFDVVLVGNRRRRPI